METFSFARTPLPATATRRGSGAKEGGFGQEDDQRRFNRWLETTELAGRPSPQLLNQAKATHVNCTEANVNVVEQSDRYEGHTADVLFTRWLDSTEAVLQSPGLGLGLASGAATPATLSRYAATPTNGLLNLPGHPLSNKPPGAAGNLDHHEKIGSGWYAASPLRLQPAFANWRDVDGSDDQCSDDDGDGGGGGGSEPGSEEEAEDGGGRGREGGWKEEGGNGVEGLVQDMEMSTINGAGDGGEEEDEGPDHMMMSPAPAAARGQRAALGGTEQVLDLMVSPVPAAHTHNTSLHRTQHPGAGGGVGQELSWGSEDGGSSSGGGGSEDESEGEVDLAGLGFTPRSANMMSPGCMQELIGLMLTPVQSKGPLDFSQ